MCTLETFVELCRFCRLFFSQGGEPLVSDASLCAEVIMELGRKKTHKKLTVYIG